MFYQSIGAVNTIIRRPRDGKLVGYNTDCEAAITAIEDALIGNIPQWAMANAIFIIISLNLSHVLVKNQKS